MSEPSRPRRVVQTRVALGMTGLALGVAALVAVGGFLLASWLGPHPQPQVETRLEQVGGRIVVVQVQRDVGATASTQDTRRNTLVWVVVALGAAFVPAAGLAWLAAGRLLRPVQQLTEVVERVDDPGTAERAGAAGEDELGMLADGVNRMLDRLEEGRREQERRLHEVVHELRTPLAVASTNLELARRNPELTDDALARIDAGRRALVRMGRTVDDLAAHGRLSVGTADGSGTPGPAGPQFDLAAEARALGGEHDAPARLRGVRLRAGGPPRLVVRGDREGLRTAAGNLLANAIRLAPAGSTVTLGWGRLHGWAWLAVNDEGPGIAAADHARVFERYWRGRYDADRDRREPPRPAGEQPRGIGLTIARQMVEAAGGRITVSSAVGEGSTFAIWLPATPDASTADIVTADGLHPIVDPFDAPETTGTTGSVGSTGDIGSTGDTLVPVGTQGA